MDYNYNGLCKRYRVGVYRGIWAVMDSDGLCKGYRGYIGVK